ncbi:stimulated by retinoic acid gene 8 protein homolog isoform X6 [Neopsephotus bourkii]|uniref:stimulated by retinoic acid gene 8 protein homolog isoform X6 n=1 Tax=Neopsephotus bourkii TaxID=309878 RepID=UPI002AA4F9A8|nr:stimulated by retinoic acid gene 8 protein homolog isoform X6 [Neopsephotus bourkii]
METAEGCRKTHARVNPSPLRQLQEAEPHVAKWRSSQARHRATLANLFSGLREAVLSRSGSSASKYQVLRKAKKSIQKLEQTLGFLLKMKAESFSLEDGNPSSLEEVREEYVKRHFSNHSTASSSEAVSESDSSVWYLIQEHEKPTLEEDRKSELIQSSDTSSPDLVEFERSAFASCTYENPKDQHMLYLQITDFLKKLFFADTQFCQLGLTRREALPHRDEALASLFKDSSSDYPFPNHLARAGTIIHWFIYFCKVCKAERSALCSSVMFHSLMSNAAQIVSQN